jgi:SAM-dependent methyltransferase
MWDERYGEEGFAYGTEPNDFLRENAHRMPVGRVLCLAEGEGRNAVWLAEQGFDVTAVDASSVGLDKAQRLAAERGVRLHSVHADLADFDIGGDAWDGILSIFCHLPPPLRVDVHRRCVKGLRAGGVFLLEAYTPRQLALKTGGPPVLDLLVEPEDLHAELSGLEFLMLDERERHIREGDFHDGVGAVVQVVARKPA